MHPFISGSINPNRTKSNRCDSGSVLPLAMFALTLSATMGAVLLLVVQKDVNSSLATHRVNGSFYGAEAALEHGREQLRQWNIASGTLELNDEIARATGPNGVIDFDPDLVRPMYDAAGNLTGFAGVGDDEPLRPLTPYDGGDYVTFLTNDPAEGRGTLIDGNQLLAVTGVSVGPDGSTETVEGVVEYIEGFPPFPAAITILGPDPSFHGGDSSAKELTGNECGRPYWVPGPSVPVVGVIGPIAETQAESGVNKPDTYREGTTETGVDTVDDISATIDPRWTDCEYLSELATKVRFLADVVGDATTPNGALGTPGNPKIVFIEGDYDIGVGFSGEGLLWVTGKLEFSGAASWSGPIFVVGTGDFDRYGAGNGTISGGSIVANISGPDGVLWTADDCSGVDGSHGTGDDGIASGGWDVSGSGSGDTIFCSPQITPFLLRWPFNLAQFRQR